MKIKKEGRCCICGGRYGFYGNNPQPLKQSGRCCNTCNDLVILSRIQNSIGPNNPFTLEHIEKV